MRELQKKGGPRSPELEQAERKVDQLLLKAEADLKLSGKYEYPHAHEWETVIQRRVVDHQQRHLHAKSDS